MLSLNKLSETEIREKILNDKSLGLSYNERGLAKELTHPKGYRPNTLSTTIGYGEEVFQLAKSQIDQLTHLNWDWLSIYTTTDHLELGSYIVSQARMFGIWGIATSKVIEIIDNSTEKEKQFGFVMGSTQYHVLKGEEAFLLNFDKLTEEVKYTIYSYSQPSSFILKIGQPFLILKQRQFVKSAISHMREKLE